ncbi:uncharacterized protein LOC144666958 isoform X2 [Oculina patagonica]
MESSTQEISAATPRELDLFGEEALEEILESIEGLRAQIDQLQIHCEKLSTEKAKVDQMLIDKEKECHAMKGQLQDDINNLRKLNLQLLSSQNTSHKGASDLSTSTGLLKEIFDSEEVYHKKLEAESRVDALQLTLLEKNKYISSLEWQLVDSEATITSVHAERDRLALELDCALAREQESDLHVLGAVGDISGYNDPLEHSDYGLVESGYVDDMPVRRVRKQPRRHLSDLTTRGTSYFDDFGAILAGHASLSDYDVPTLAEKESRGLGNLKRATNFSNINNLDECEKFDKRKPHSPTLQGWESFDDTDGGLSPALNKNKWDRFADASNTKEDKVSEAKGDKDDLWTFTPDSIINVSTGEDLSSLPDEELNNIRRLSKDCSMLHENIRLEGSTTGQQVNSGVMPVQRRESMPAEKENVEVNVGGHQKTASEPVTTKDVCNNNKQMPGSENKNVSNKRLDEYHKWKVSGCKGDPPAKLKISQ